MRVIVRLVWFFLFVLVFSVSANAATNPASSQNTIPSGRSEVVFGMVSQVNYLREANSRDPIVEIRLQQGDKTFTVRLGPSSFLNQYGFALKEGEDISARVRRDASSSGDKTVFVGMEITKGSRRLTLRDENGQPLW